MIFAIVLFLVLCWIAAMLLYGSFWLLGWASWAAGFAWQRGRQRRRIKQARADWQPTLPSPEQEPVQYEVYGPGKIRVYDPLLDLDTQVERDTAGRVTYDPLDDPLFIQSLRRQNYYPDNRKDF